MMSVLQFVAKRAGFDLPPEAGEKIVADANGNLRKAILVLEALKMQSYESLSSYGGSSPKLAVLGQIFQDHYL